MPLPKSATALLRVALVAPLLALLLHPSPGVALGAPFAVPRARPADATPHCDISPAPTRFLSVDSAYRTGDETYSQIDRDRQAARTAALQSIRQFTRRVAHMSNAYVASGGRDVESGTCALRWLERWANYGALTNMPDHDAQFVRSVNLAGWTLAYLQVRDLRFDNKNPHPSIRRWFGIMADDLQQHTNRITNVTARNNHRYWAALASMGVAVATDDRSRMQWAVQSAMVGLDQVTSEGALPLELDRAGRARHYHFYSAAPLVLTAELGLANQVDLYRYRGGALHRLVNFTVNSLARPSRIAQLAKAQQVRLSSPPTASEKQNMAWVELYGRRFPGRAPGVEAILVHRPLINVETGGNMTLLATGRTR